MQNMNSSKQSMVPPKIYSEVFPSFGHFLLKLECLQSKRRFCCVRLHLLSFSPASSLLGTSVACLQPSQSILMTQWLVTPNAKHKSWLMPKKKRKLKISSLPSLLFSLFVWSTSLVLSCGFGVTEFPRAGSVLCNRPIEWL